MRPTRTVKGAGQVEGKTSNQFAATKQVGAVVARWPGLTAWPSAINTAGRIDKSRVQGKQEDFGLKQS